MKHLLVTNDFPPKMGGIQQYLWELWRRLPPGDVTVLTTPHEEAATFDAEQPFRVVRTKERVLLPTPGLRTRIDALAEEVGAELVLLDPALPVGALGPRLARPYGLIVHGAEITVPGRIPVARPLLGHLVRGAELVIAAGGYPLSEAARAAGVERMPRAVVVPPGVDVERFVPATDEARASTRAGLGIDPQAPLVVGVSRLVPRKGFDVVIDAMEKVTAELPGAVLAIAGAGRDRGRLERRAGSTGSDVRFLGRIDDASKVALLGAADVFAMVCRDRWLGLEQEGFGIVFLEAAACGVPQIAGASGGSAEAVVHDKTGMVVDSTKDEASVAAAILDVLSDDQRRARLGEAARRRAVDEFSYDVLSGRLAEALS